MTHAVATHPAAARRAPVAWLLAVLLLVGATWLAVPTTASAAAANEDFGGGLTVAPSLVEIEVDPGSTGNAALTVVNTFDVAMTFTIGTEDIVGSKSDPLSTPILVGGVLDSPISAASWVQPAQSTIHLDPGDSGTVKVNVSVPAGTKPAGHYAAVTISTPSIKLGGDLHGRSRVAVPFMIDAGHVPPPELTITDVSTRKDGTTTVAYVDKGVKAATPEGTITWVDPVTGHTVGTTKASDCTTAFPGTKGRCSIPALDTTDSTKTTDDDAHPGRIDSGTRKGSISLVGYGSHARASTPTQWKGSWSSMLLPLVGLALFVLYFARLRRRDEDEDELDDDLYATPEA